MTERTLCLCAETCACYGLGKLTSRLEYEMNWGAIREAEARGYERCRTAVLAVLETMRLDPEVLRLGQAAKEDHDV